MFYWIHLLLDQAQIRRTVFQICVSCSVLEVTTGCLTLKQYKNIFLLVISKNVSSVISVITTATIVKDVCLVKTEEFTLWQSRQENSDGLINWN